MSARVTLRSTSFEEDAALVALADLGGAVADWTHFRVVGGHMVSLHVAMAGVDVIHRPTGDAFPELAHALRGDPLPVRVRVEPFAGDGYGPFTVAIPPLAAAIVVKACAGRPKDAVDLDRLLAAAAHTGVALPAPPQADADLRAAAEYLHGPYLRAADQQRRLLVERVVPRPEPRGFLDL